MNRDPQIEAFLRASGWSGAVRVPLAGDASFRRYERVRTHARKAILMDAPPEREDVRPFIAVGNYLRSRGLSAPEIYAHDIAAGLLLLEDLGDDLYSALLRTGVGPDEDFLYRRAIDILVDLQSAPPRARLPVTAGHSYALPPYDQARLLDETALFVDWYLPALTGHESAVRRAEFIELWQQIIAPLARVQPNLVLRDYHADNLLWLPERAALARVGILDFQDAVLGHPAYDLVSLLQDARRDVSESLEQTMLGYYLSSGGVADTDAFRAAYNILGAQRNTKIIGIFTRLWLRDGKAQYLSLIPRVWGLLARDLAAPELAGLRTWFGGVVPLEERARPEPEALRATWQRLRAQARGPHPGNAVKMERE